MRITCLVMPDMQDATGQPMPTIRASARISRCKWAHVSEELYMIAPSGPTRLIVPRRAAAAVSAQSELPRRRI